MPEGRQEARAQRDEQSGAINKQSVRRKAEPRAKTTIALERMWLLYPVPGRKESGAEMPIEETPHPEKRPSVLLREDGSSTCVFKRTGSAPEDACRAR